MLCQLHEQLLTLFQEAAVRTHREYSVIPAQAGILFVLRKPGFRPSPE